MKINLVFLISLTLVIMAVTIKHVQMKETGLLNKLFKELDYQDQGTFKLNSNSNSLMTFLLETHDSTAKCKNFEECFMVKKAVNSKKFYGIKPFKWG